MLGAARTVRMLADCFLDGLAAAASELAGRCLFARSRPAAQPQGMLLSRDRQLPRDPEVAHAVGYSTTE